MEDVSLLHGHQWHPLEWLGLQHPFFALEAETVLYTWVAIGIMAALAVMGRILLVKYPQTTAAFTIKWVVRSFITMVTQACKRYEYRYVSFFLSLLVFLLVANCLIIIPTLEEPTKDINTTLALSIFTFLFIQSEAVRAHGLFPYLNEFFQTPVAVRGVYARITVWSVGMTALRILANIVIGTLMLPIELMGKLSSIISLSFRLFGNILAGSVISSLWLHFRSGSILRQTLGLVTGMNLLITLFFGIFEGCVQAFVFVMLSLSFLGRVLQQH